MWNSVPALLELLTGHLERMGGSLDSLRLALLSGDWIPVTLPARVRALAPRCELISLGGATEAAIWSVWHPIEEADGQRATIPYGKPLANQRLYVMNPQLVLCPLWVQGEIYIAGRGLAQGYWGDTERTDAAFFPHPRTGERLYRTGDLGRYLPSGDIELLGRADRQIKLHGHRIEPMEIESALLSISHIAQQRWFRSATRRVCSWWRTWLAPRHPIPRMHRKHWLLRLRRIAPKNSASSRFASVSRDCETSILRPRRWRLPIRRSEKPTIWRGEPIAASCRAPSLPKPGALSSRPFVTCACPEPPSPSIDTPRRAICIRCRRTFI